MVCYRFCTESAQPKLPQSLQELLQSVLCSLVPLLRHDLVRVRLWLLVFLALSPLCGLRGQTTSSASANHSATPEAAASAAPAENAPSDDQKKGLDLPVMEGQDIVGIRIPHYNDHGQLLMLVHAEVARRLDENHIQMESLRIDFWSAERQQYILVMPKARYLIANRTLSGYDGARIEREDFLLEGQNLEFNLDTQTGVMLGEVTMTIRGVETLSESP